MVGDVIVVNTKSLVGLSAYMVGADAKDLIELPTNGTTPTLCGREGSVVYGRQTVP